MGVTEFVLFVVIVIFPLLVRVDFVLDVFKLEKLNRSLKLSKVLINKDYYLVLVPIVGIIWLLKYAGKVDQLIFDCTNNSADVSEPKMRYTHITTLMICVLFLEVFALIGGNEATGMLYLAVGLSVWRFILGYSLSRAVNKIIKENKNL